jgi:hypothetical protein
MFDCLRHLNQGCQMVFSNQKKLGKFLRVLQWKMLVYLHILETFSLFYGHLVYFMDIWYKFVVFRYMFSVWVCCTKKNLATLVGICTHMYNTGQLLQMCC